MPRGDAISPNEALKTLGAFMEEHAAHYGCHQPDIRPDGITLLCDGHSPPIYEVIDVEQQAMMRVMGEELSERRMVTF